MSINSYHVVIQQDAGDTFMKMFGDPGVQIFDLLFQYVIAMSVFRFWPKLKEVILKLVIYFEI